VGVTIRRAIEQDTTAISVMLGEVEAYYGGHPAPVDEQQIRVALFSEPAAATVLLAEQGGRVVGFASFSSLWPATGADVSLYLKELYVRADARCQGVGRQLLAAVREAGEELGCSRLEWTGDTDNPAALGFYEKLGVPVSEGKVFYRVAL